MKKLKHALTGYWCVLFGYDVYLNDTDKRILEILADNGKELKYGDFENCGLRYIQPNLLKLKKTGFIQEEIFRQMYSIYKILPKGVHYLEKPPLSRGERYIILLTIAGIVATIITGILTSHK